MLKCDHTDEDLTSNYSEIEDIEDGLQCQLNCNSTGSHTHVEIQTENSLQP